MVLWYNLWSLGIFLPFFGMFLKARKIWHPCPWTRNWFPPKSPCQNDGEEFSNSDSVKGWTAAPLKS
jgi:hypothetical protein